MQYAVYYGPQNFVLNICFSFEIFPNSSIFLGY
jgi:hypothetical protein